MNLINLKSNAAFLLVALSFGNSIACADDTAGGVTDSSIYKKSCINVIMQKANGQEAAKQLADKVCGCFGEKFANLIASKGGAEPSDKDGEKIMGSCGEIVLLDKVAEKLTNSQNIDAALVEDTCKSTNIALGEQMGETSGNSPEELKFCHCTAEPLANALTATLNDDEFNKRIDIMVDNCSGSK